MLNLPENANQLFNAVPFPDHEGGLFGNGHAIVRWCVGHCAGDLSVRPDGTTTPKATVTVDRTKLRTVLAAAALAWPETVPALPEEATGLPPRLASQWLPELLPLAEHNPREHLTLYQRPMLRLRFEPVPEAALWIMFRTDTVDVTRTVIGGMHAYNYKAVTRFMQGLHDSP